jgi:hypothetical protein
MVDFDDVDSTLLACSFGHAFAVGMRRNEPKAHSDALCMYAKKENTASYSQISQFMTLVHIFGMQN